MIGNKKSVRGKFHRGFAWLMAGICLMTSVIWPEEKVYAKTEYDLGQYEEKKMITAP